MITRFAPSPTGPLHLGHAYSALLASDMAHSLGGTFLLRIEDIDRNRSRATWEKQIFDDLSWLGLSWPVPVLRQSTRQRAYAAALQTLWAKGVVYSCSCKRRDIATAASAPQEGAAPMGPDGIIYPGTCRQKGMRGPAGSLPMDHALRLDTQRALSCLGAQEAETLAFTETGKFAQAQMVDITPDHLMYGVGDIVLSRREMGTSYHLSVVLDDAEQGITHVIRGEDLFEATQIHVLLQHLLGLPTPIYHHHRLIRDEAGKRLAKRDDARAISTFRAEGATPADIRGLVGLQRT